MGSVVHTYGDMDGQIFVINEHETCSIFITSPRRETVPPGTTREYRVGPGLSAWTRCDPRLRITLTIGRRRAHNAILRLYPGGAFDWTVEWRDGVDGGWIWIIVATVLAIVFVVIVYVLFPNTKSR